MWSRNIGAGDSSEERNYNKMSTNLPTFERLEGSINFSTWKFQMELYLTHEDLWEYVSTTPPITDLSATKKDAKARAKICLMINPELLVHVRQAKSTKECWEALVNSFEDRGVTNRCRLLGRLVSYKLEQFSNVRDYITAIMKVAQQLRDIGKEVDDEMLAALMLQGLTEEYNPMKMAIENSNIVLTSDYVKTKLLQQDDDKSSKSSDENALLMRNKAKSSNVGAKDGNKNKQLKKEKKIKCFICGGPHKAMKCSKNPKKNEGNSSLLTAFTATTGDNEWIVDSGASSHMTHRKDWLTDYTVLDNVVNINVANGQQLSAIGSGDVRKAERMQFGVKNVMYVPGLTANLLSVSTLVDRDFIVVFSENGCEIYDRSDCHVKGKVLYSCENVKGVYKFKADTNQTLFSAPMSDEFELWHRRLAHLGASNMKLLRDGLARGVSFKIPDKLQCEPCLKGKQTRKPFNKSGAKRASEVLELIHSDVCGPLSVESNGGKRYFLLFIDDKTRYTFVYFLREKSEVFSKIFEFKKLVENQTNKKIKVFRSDNGKEFVNKQVSQLFKESGIIHQTTVEFTPEQNGVAERANRSIMEKARCMLEEANLGSKFWAEAVNTAVYLKNRSPTKAVKVTPLEAWCGEKPNLSMLKVFGCKAFMHITKAKRTKLDAKSKEFIFVGYCTESKAYRLCDPANLNIHKARDVVFFENQFFNQREREVLREEPKPIMKNNNREEIEKQGRRQLLLDFPTESETETVEERTSSEETIGERIVEQGQAQPERQDEFFHDSIDDNVQSEVDEEEFRTPPAEEKRYPQRERKAKNFSDYHLYQAEAKEQREPESVEQALSGCDREKWQEAIDAELNALKKNGTWSLVKPEPSKVNFNLVDSKWIFKIKKEPGGKVRYKARLVARGFTQRYGLDFNETFSPVIRHSTLRLLFAFAVENDLAIDQMDVVTAFLNGDLTERVYMKQPRLCEVKGKEDHVCLLKKALYGLKQAPRAWNKKLHDVLIHMQFKQSASEPCVYIRNMVIIAVYVDDILIFYKNKKERDTVKNELKRKFEMKDLGKIDSFLGMKVNRLKEEISVDQSDYINMVLKRFGMSDCKPARTPLPTGIKLEKPNSDHIPPKEIPYQSLIGSVMYLAVCSRPDISYAVSYLSQFNNCYTSEHWSAAKRLLRYLKGTINYKLNFVKTRQSLTGYVDADHAGDHSDRKSFTGYVFVLGGAPVSWESKKQHTVALSSAESEYVAMSESCREAVFLKTLIREISSKDETVKLFSDSQSAIQMAKNPVHHQRTKHIDIRYHFIREKLNNSVVSLEYLQTELMTADILTKALPKCKHEYCVDQMNIRA